MTLVKVAEKFYPDSWFQGECHEGQIEWYSLPIPFDFGWFFQEIVEQYVALYGGTMIKSELYAEAVYGILGYPILYHYQLIYRHHVVPVAVAAAILAAIKWAIITAAVIGTLYIIFEIVKTIFIGSPERYTPVTPGECRSGYVYDASTRECVRVTPRVEELGLIALGVAALGIGAYAVTKIISKRKG